jgi:hypothetical protein
MVCLPPACCGALAAALRAAACSTHRCSDGMVGAGLIPASLRGRMRSRHSLTSQRSHLLCRGLRCCHCLQLSAMSASAVLEARRWAWPVVPPGPQGLACLARLEQVGRAAGDVHQAHGVGMLDCQVGATFLSGPQESNEHRLLSAGCGAHVSTASLWPHTGRRDTSVDGCAPH